MIQKIKAAIVDVVSDITTKHIVETHYRYLESLSSELNNKKQGRETAQN